MATLTLRDFSGGLNLRDSPAELSPNETPSAVNWTLDQRGAIRIRNGCALAATLPGVSGKPAYIFYSEGLDQWLCARETSATPNRLHLWTRPGDFSGSWTDRGDVAGTNGLPLIAAFTEFSGNPPRVIISSAPPTTTTYVGAVYTWNGTTLTQVANTIGGFALATWQNRVWLAGTALNDANGTVTRLFACAIGDPATWAVASGGTTVDIRDIDGERLMGLGVVGGSLIVFKRTSAYRVGDSATGAYQVIDPAAGATGPMTVVTQGGRLYTWGADGLYEWNGVGPARNVGDKCRPLFVDNPVLADRPTTLCGGPVSGHILYAFPATKGGANQLQLEFDPLHGWLMKHAPFAGYPSSYARKGDVLYAATPDTDKIISVYDQAPGNDAGDGYSPDFWTSWLQPFGGKRARLHRAQIEGMRPVGATDPLLFRLHLDWSSSVALDIDISDDLETAADQAMVVTHALGQGRAFQFRFVPGSGGSPVAAASISSLALDFTQLER